MKPIAFVIPWYGDNIRGGAEMECNHLAHCFTDAGVDVEVLTTCVLDAACDRGINTMEPGTYIESGITVRRFSVKKQGIEEYNNSNYKLYHNLPTTLEEEEAYYREDINSPDMYQYINKHRDDYACFIFIPYLYGPTYNGSQMCPENALMIPCFHDESYAHMILTKERVKSFKGLIFLSKPESDFAKGIYDLNGLKHKVLGAYVETGWENSCDVQGFRNKYGIHNEFLLFAGRKDAGKKADELVNFFIGYKKTNPECSLKLVMIGGGTLDIPSEYKNDIIDLGFVTTEDKHNAFAAAKVLCNPSYFESFSLVIMESWLAKRPVLVSEHCKVTTNFCLESNGGLYYSDFYEFCGCLDYISNHNDECNVMGQNGFEYVKGNFTKDKITEKYLDFIEDVLPNVIYRKE